MRKIIRIGMDISKKLFQLHGVDGEEKMVVRKTLRRSHVVDYFSRLEPTKIGMEACGSAHYWGRKLKALGHEVVLLPPQYVKAYLKRGKNDKADAEAICEAMSRPTMRFVPIKSAEQQGALMITSIKDLLTKIQTMLSNGIRGHAAEFGLIAELGHDKIKPLLTEIMADGALPETAQSMLKLLALALEKNERLLKVADKALIDWHRTNECSRRLAEIAGIGPIGAVLMTMKAPDPQLFKSGRDFAAWIGLTPKDHSTAGKQRSGVITRAGDEGLRSVLVVGATSMIKVAKRHPDRVSPWLKAIVQRKPPKLAAVALANKNARIAWKLMVSGERYKKHHAVKASPKMQAA